MRLEELDKKTVAKWSYQTMYWGFLLFVLLFPFGKSFREIGGIIALVCVPVYYWADWDNSNLKRFGLKWIYFLFWAFILFKVFHSINWHPGFYAVKTNLHKGIILYFAGLEFVREERDLKRLVTAFAASCFVEGLDGMWQYFSGVDFIRGTAISGDGRLTGSLGTYRVGNFMSAALLPCLALPILFSRRLPNWSRLLLAGVILFPGLFLLVFAKARSAYFGFAIACFALYVYRYGWKWKVVSFLAAAAVFLLFFGPERTSWERVVSDGRIQELWPFAIEVFKEWPILGSGANTYNPAFRSLGLVPRMHNLDIAHPHNVYLQFLAEMGVIGFAMLLLFWGSHLAWGFWRLLEGRRSGGWSHSYSLMTCCFLAAFLGYTGTALSGHNFFRSWWLAIALSLLGVAMGACLRRNGETTFEKTV